MLQTERAFQKQFGVTGCFKSKEKKAPGKSGHRYWKQIGLGFKTPKEAIEGVYIIALNAASTRHLWGPVGALGRRAAAEAAAEVERHSPLRRSLH